MDAFLLVFALKDIEWMYLLPIGKEGLLPILSSVKSTIFSFLGFEVAFILYPFLKDKNSASKGIVIANSLSMLIYLTTTLVCFIRFSPMEVTDYVYPMLNLFKVIQLPFVERLEIICLSFYLVVIFMLVIPSLYVAVLGTSQLLGKQDHRNPLRIIIFLWIIVSFFFIPGASQITQMANSWGMAGLYSAFVFPIFLWIYGWMFHFVRKEAKQ
ncbi:GerAB/ArcD/ProY family transporter [Paenibacillus frigoriresistens]|nr:GerAB/ArcD/ProY family transporter [Paenibacillus frigoriresistens]